MGGRSPKTALETLSRYLWTTPPDSQSIEHRASSSEILLEELEHRQRAFHRELSETTVSKLGQTKFTPVPYEAKLFTNSPFNHALALHRVTAEEGNNASPHLSRFRGLKYFG